MPQTFGNAKKFVSDRVVEQARLEELELTPIEVSMLGFSEETAGRKQLAAAEQFEREYDDTEFETKVAGLLRRAYDRDRANGMKEEWEAALDELVGHDPYILVMIRQAEILKEPDFGMEPRLLIAVAPIVAIAGAGVVAGFTPIGARLMPNEYVRLAVTAALFIAPCFLYRKSQHRAEALLGGEVRWWKPRSSRTKPD